MVYTKPEFYRTNTKSGPSCSKTSISINKYMQKAGESENDAGFLKHVYSQLK